MLRLQIYIIYFKVIYYLTTFSGGGVEYYYCYLYQKKL